ncbi:hypothetical protein H0H81_003505 [Sphagnurus paluster]|uniref:Fatty acid hydroxylase domain-containing protein n=1 Tax=Sphagnurus paluster TaxID=117069 RepID=A0A9P7K908_9AGAR|nr:hypothetical protein H0H81_003505 [Sphagnurus paluster]
MTISLASAWKQLLIDYPHSTLECLGTFIVQTTFFWGISAFYTSLPYVFPDFSTRHKLQKQEKQPTKSELWECFKIVSRNQMVSTSLQMGLITLNAAAGRPTSPYRFDATLPTPIEVLRDVVLGVFFREILFYYIHRLFHHPSLYATFHKPHHRFTAPVALATQYSTITEHLLANVVPVSLPLIILRSHIVTFWVFLSVVLVEVTTVHSGYDFFAGSARAHDSHHEKFTVNFGTIGLLDWLHGTSASAKAKRVD